MSAETFVGLHVKSLYFPHANASLLSMTVFLKFWKGMYRARPFEKYVVIPYMIPDRRRKLREETF